MKTAKALVEDTKTLVAGAASSQEQLAVAAQNAVTTIVQLSDVVKNGAASLGSQNQEAQVFSSFILPEFLQCAICFFICTFKNTMAFITDCCYFNICSCN